MDIQFRQAESGDVDVVSAVLTDAAAWLEARGMGMWRASELTPAEILEDVSEGLFFLAEHAGQPVGTMKFQLSDVLFWPDVPQDEAAFIHRVAVRREFAGGTVSSALLSFASQRTRSLGRRFFGSIAKPRGRDSGRYTNGSGSGTIVTVRLAPISLLGTSLTSAS